MFSKTFLRDALERALSTAAQSALLVLGADQINALVVGWVDVAGFAAGGAALSLLKSLAARNVGEPESAALILGKA